MFRVDGFELSADKSKLVVASADIPSEERFSIKTFHIWSQFQLETFKSLKFLNRQHSRPWKPNKSAVIIAVFQRDNLRRYSTKTFQIRVNTTPSANAFQIRPFVPPGEEELESLGLVQDSNGIPYKLDLVENAEFENFLAAFTTGKLFPRPLLLAVLFKFN